MDVLHVVHQFAPETRGGSESYVRDVVMEQRARGRDAQVLSGSLEWWPKAGLEELEVDGIPVHRLHRDDLYFDHHAKAWHPGVEQLFTGLLTRLQPKVVHVHHWLRLTCNLVELARRQDIPAVVTLHDFYSSCPRAFRMRKDDAACRRPLSVQSCIDCVPRFGHEPREELAAGIELFADSYRSELALAAAVLVAVGSTADLLAASTGLPRSRYQVLPLGYRRRFPGAAKGALPAVGAPFRFAYWGSIGRHKGLGVLLDAFRMYMARPGAASAELHVLGDFATKEFEGELRAQAAGLPVTFHGPFAPAQLLAVAPHCGVFPSTCLETFGLVLDECNELGLPCIVSDHGALPERAGGAGLRAVPGDAASLAEAMARISSDRWLWQRLVAARPPLPPDMDHHVGQLERIHAAAGAARPGSDAAPVAVERRIAFLQQQRESALGRAIPEGGPR